MDNVKKTCKQEDKLTQKVITGLWTLYTLLATTLCLFLDYSAGDRVIMTWISITVVLLILNSIWWVNTAVLTAASAIKFSVLLIFSIPLFIMIYGASNLHYHIKRHAKMFARVQKTRMRVLSRAR